MIRSLHLALENVTTDASDANMDSVSTGGVKSGHILQVQITGTDTDCDIDVIAEAANGLPETTLFTKNDVNCSTGSVTYPVVQQTDTAGTVVAAQYQPIPVCEQKITLKAGDSSTGTKNVLCTVIYDTDG